MAKVKKELTSEQRVQIKALFDPGWSYHHLGCHLIIYGIMDRKVYHNNLVRHGVPYGSHLIGPGFIFQEDNDLNFLLTIAGTTSDRSCCWNNENDGLTPSKSDPQPH